MSPSRVLVHESCGLRRPEPRYSLDLAGEPASTTKLKGCSRESIPRTRRSTVIWMPKPTKGLIGHPEDMPVIDGEEDILRAFCKHLEGTEGQMSETEPQSN